MSSARDVAAFLAYLYRKPELYSGTTERSRSFKPLNAETLYAENTNDAIPDIPGLIFGKTGFTDLAGGTLAILFELGPNRPVAAVVLGSSSKEGRFTDMRALVRLAQTRPE
jgi:D-alanyl-D-alanine carboxypeptidase